MNIWTLMLLGAGALAVVGLLALLGGILRAPAGSEDGEGFHFEAEPELLSKTEQQVTLTLAQSAGDHLGHAA